MTSLLRKLTRSLTNRLLLVFLITCLLMTTLIIQMLIRGFATQWETNMRPHLVQYLDYVNADIGNPPSVDRANELAKELPINIYIRGKDLSYTSTGSPLDVSDLEFHHSPAERWRQRKTKDASAPLIEPEFMFGEHEDRSVLRVTIGEYEVYYELRHGNRTRHRDDVIGKTLLGLLLLLAACYFLIRRMLRPVQDIKTGVHRMGDGELDYRVPVHTNNDLGVLAGSINAMAIDIEQMLDAKRQLLLGVSHELRSPLTRAKIATELLDDSKNRSRIQEDLQEMDNLITEILETERMNTRHAAINRTSVNLEDLVHDVLQDLSVSNITTSIEPELSPCQLDEPRIRLLLRNLISNAVKHGGDAEPPPHVSATKDNSSLTIRVTDNGPGVAAEHIDRLTEPFYRVDPSRTRATGGFGIGLYLCKLIANAHNGELNIESQPGKGTTVTVRLSC